MTTDKCECARIEEYVRNHDALSSGDTVYCACGRVYDLVQIDAYEVRERAQAQTRNEVAPHAPWGERNKEGVTIREWAYAAKCLQLYWTRAVYNAWKAGEDPMEYAARTCTACGRVELMCSAFPCDAVRAARVEGDERNG